jgi:cyclase
MPAHTTNDSIVWIPERSVLFCGDLIFNGGTPFLLMGSVAGALQVLDQVIAPLAARTIVPGHGPVFEGAEPIERTLAYLRFVQQAAVSGREAGLTPLEAAIQTDLGEFAQWPDAERPDAPPGATVDIIAALGDMVAYNGGAPLTCLA